MESTSRENLTGTIEWSNIHVQPGTSPPLLVESDPSRYYAARQTDAATVTVGGQQTTIRARSFGAFASTRFPTPVRSPIPSMASSTSLSRSALGARFRRSGLRWSLKCRIRQDAEALCGCSSCHKMSAVSLLGHRDAQGRKHALSARTRRDSNHWASTTAALSLSVRRKEQAALQQADPSLGVRSSRRPGRQVPPRDRNSIAAARPLVVNVPISAQPAQGGNVNVPSQPTPAPGKEVALSKIGVRGQGRETPAYMPPAAAFQLTLTDLKWKEVTSLAESAGYML